MGEVYRAEDPRLGRHVAIKVLPVPLAELPEFRRRFERESRAISRLNHKNICTIYDTGTHENRPYIVMEFLEGRTLESLIQEGPVEMELLLHVAIQAADALDAAHRAGVIHRDVKSANIFLNNRGDAKVLDFGIAKLAGSGPGSERATDPDLTRVGGPIGTLAFMSPEQARGEDVDARSDLFSFGTVLFEMATGVTPFRGTASSIIAQLVSPDPALSARSVNPGIPSGLDRIISRALEKDRTVRYQTAADLLAALRGLRRDLFSPSGSTDPEGRHRAASPGRPPRRSITPALMAVVLFLGAALLGRQYLLPGIFGDGPIRSMAVIPCTDPREQAGYLCDLLAERIILGLSEVPGLAVQSFQAVEEYVGSGLGAMEIGKEMNVDAVLTALVRERSDNLSVTIEVTDVRTGDHVWGRPYQSGAGETQRMHEDIALDVAENLQLRLSATDRARLRVFQTYQQAKYYSDQRTAASLERAVGLFSEVIEADSTFARAYVGLASSHILLHYYGSLSPAEAYPRARDAAMAALALDESLADAHASLALVMRDYDRDWTRAEREFQRALQLDPQSTTSLQWYAELLAMVGRFEEAEARIQEAQRTSLSLIVRAVHGWILTCAGDFNAARRQLETTVEMDEDFPQSYWFLGQLRFAQGDYAGAVEALESATQLSERANRMVADLASGYAMAGRRDRARELLEELENKSGFGANVSRYELAIVYAGLGEDGRALAELEGALEERTWQVVNMGIDPMLNPLRGDPRFQDLLLRVGLPSE
jgi:tetratricopeptide (TPR) repeat protein